MKHNRQEQGATTRKIIPLVLLLSLLFIQLASSALNPQLLPTVHAQGTDTASILPSAKYWGVFFGSRGDIRIDIDKAGLAVRVEVPREFMSGVAGENDTSFVESDIRNDYYYYSVVDEARHWSYDWNRTINNGPCFKPGFAFYDPNAPWCVEIWNYLNGSFHNFTAPRFVKLNLLAPRIAGIYNFTVFIATSTNRLGFPDFLHAWNKTLLVPVAMRDNPSWINGTIVDCFAEIPILARGVAYATDPATKRVARAYVNQTTGRFSLTGLDRSVTQYYVQASAGMFREPDGTVWAFSLTPYQANNGLLPPHNTVSVCLDRAPQIWGKVQYVYRNDSTRSVLLPLTTHPWLTKVGFKKLNVTVEAVDSMGHVYRNQTISKDSGDDDFRIITGLGENYTGLNSLGNPDPYGTIFAGLPQTASFALSNIRAWISGYTQKEVVSTDPLVITAPCGDVACGPPNTGQSPIIKVWTGGLISGNITFNHCPACLPTSIFTTQTPFQAEQNLPNVPVTQKLYGGNVVVEAYDSSNTLRGIATLNQTRADGKSTFANSTSIQFFIVGFSEFYNRSLTFAGADTNFHKNDPSKSIPMCVTPGSVANGPRCWKDYGLDVGQYTLKVYLRGYEIRPGDPPTVNVPDFGIAPPLNATMVEGGAISVVVTSYDNRPGTRVIQAELPWRFLNLSIPIRARVYFYDQPGYAIGYEERLMITGIPTPPNGVNISTFQVIFAGENWSIRDILYFGWRPSHIRGGNYTVDAFTLGYVHLTLARAQANANLAALSKVRIGLLYGNAIGVTGIIQEGPGTIFIPIPEHQHVIAETTSSARLNGAMIQNLTQGFPSPIDLTIYGFGAMELNRTFTGLGHFFYVPRSELIVPRCSNYGFNQTDFNHCFDYGLDKGIYYANIPEFGFQKHFIEYNQTTIPVTFNDLFLAQDHFTGLVLMAQIKENRAVVGESCEGDNVPLSWIQVVAVSSGQSASTFTLDGTFSLYVRGDYTYTVTFSMIPLYPQQPIPGITLQNLAWGSVTPILPPVSLIPSGSVCP